MENLKSRFAQMSEHQLQQLGIEPLPKPSEPVVLQPSQESSITLSILEGTGQRFGEAVPGETTGK